MIDAYFEDQEEESSSSSSSSSQQTVSSTPTNINKLTSSIYSNNELTLATIKDYLSSKNGKVRYSELNAHFKEIGIDSNDKKFQEFLSNLVIRKHETNSDDDLIILKKVYKDSGLASPPNHGFFASKLQKTKQSLSKAFSKGIEKDINKSLNLSTNSSNSSSTSSFHASSSSFSASNLTELSMFKQSNNLHRKSSLVSSNPSLANPSLSATSTKTNLHEIFELDKLINDLSFSKSYSEKPHERKQSISLDENYTSLENDYHDEDQDVGVTSVKEQAKKLNRLSTKTDLRNQIEIAPKSRKNSTNKDLNMKQVIPAKNIELESIDISNPNSIEKEWLLVCSRCDYMEMAKILLKNPYLAQKKDPFTGYSCAHWAVKYGNIEILKLIASTLENDTKTNPKSIRINNLINSRTRAGYTCLHIAYIFKHGTDLVSILKRYGAEGLVDYSGRQALEYSKSMQNSSTTQAIEQNEFKAPNSETINESVTSSLVKRTGSILMPKEAKDLFLSNNSLKSNENRMSKIRANSLRSYETNTIQKPFLPPSPLAAIEPYNNSTNSALMPPPSTTNIFFKSKKTNIEDIYQNEENNYRESKENIFI